MEFYNFRAKIISVYDGDTYKAEVDLGFDTKHIVNLRLAGVDTPEIRGWGRKKGLKVRDIVREMILDKQVILRTNKNRTGKFGRYIADVFIDEINLGEWLVENKYAKYYGT